LGHPGSCRERPGSKENTADATCSPEKETFWAGSEGANKRRRRARAVASCCALRPARATRGPAPPPASTFERTTRRSLSLPFPSHVQDPFAQPHSERPVGLLVSKPPILEPITATLQRLSPTSPGRAVADPPFALLSPSNPSQHARRQLDLPVASSGQTDERLAQHHLSASVTADAYSDPFRPTLGESRSWLGRIGL
jgi:hypothetical protein